MSKALSNLLGQPEHVIASFIETLERLSGSASEDIRLLEEVSHAVMNKTAGLGLDPHDTNGRELYYGAQARFASDSAGFEKVVGASKKESLDKKLNRLAKLAEHSGTKREVWALKHSAAKDLLHANPPKALMRQLHYRSIDSMLKHEDIVGLFAVIPFTTSVRWQRSFWKAQAKLSPLDFETRSLEVVTMPAKRWRSVIDNAPAIASAAELGAVVLWPNKAAEQADSLAAIALILEATEKVRLSCVVAKSYQGGGNYGANVSKIWQGELPALATLAGHSLGWQSFLHYLGHQPDLLHPEEFEPYVYPQDLHWQSANEQLSALHPSLAWWSGGSHLLHNTAKGVSLNVADVALNHLRGADYKQRSVSIGRQAFWDELVGRYLQHQSVFSRVTGQLEQSLTPSVVRVTPEDTDLPSLSSQVLAI